MKFVSRYRELVQSERDDKIRCEKDGYVYKLQAGCHRFHKVSPWINWTDAQKSCQREKANLTIINSKVEAEVRR